MAGSFDDPGERAVDDGWLQDGAYVHHRLEIKI
jgi:hypothetical protein